MRMPRSSIGLLALLLAACGPTSPGGATGDGGGGGGGGGGSNDGGGGPATCGSGDRPACAAAWEAAAASALTAATGSAAALSAFVTAMPKGGDLHNHLSGAVYGETLLGWGKADGDCVGSANDTAVEASSCSASNLAIPTTGSFFDAIIAAWSMQGFVAGAQTGHDHFFATFAKYGLIAGYHRDDSLADLATRAAAQNEVYVETMFNLGENTGDLATDLGGSAALGSADLAAFYTKVTTNAGFGSAVAKDVAVVTSAQTGYLATLGCSAASPPAACGVKLRFVAQIARTGTDAQVFGQLIGAFEMAKTTPYIVAADLSSPEDDTRSIANYDIQMQMLGFLRAKYTATGASPLHVTLHAGELVPQYLPAGDGSANTYHVRAAVEIAQAERIGHGVDVMSETDPDGLMDEMASKGVMVEICLSSNLQILLVSGTAHPLAQYIAHGVPVALATDDQGVSRSSMAGEYTRAVLDQHLAYLQLKTMARTSLEHAFLPGASLWTALGTATPVSACAATPAMALGDPPNAGCAAYLAASERATAQWELEGRFLAFESQQ